MDFRQRLEEIRESTRERISESRAEYRIADEEVVAVEKLKEAVDRVDTVLEQKIQEFRNPGSTEDLQDSIGQLQVFVGAEMENELEAVERKIGNLKTAGRDAPERDLEIAEVAEEVIENLRSGSMRLTDVLNQMETKLDRGMDAVEVSRELVDYTENWKQEFLQPAERKAQKLEEGVSTGSIARTKGIKKKPSEIRSKLPF